MTVGKSMANIAFKGTRLGEAFFGSRVSSALGRCSGLVVGVPLNLTLGLSEKSCRFSVCGYTRRPEQEHLEVLSSLLANVRRSITPHPAHNERDRPAGKCSGRWQASLRPIVSRSCPRIEGH